MSEKKINEKEIKKIIEAYSNIFALYMLSRINNKDILTSVVNAVLINKNFKPIKSAEVNNPINFKTFTEDKDSCLDIVATDENDKSYNIEIQISYQTFFIGRLTYYWSKMFIGQIEESENYDILKPVTSIALIDFDMFDGDNMHHLGEVVFDGQLKPHLKNNEDVSNLMRLHIIEMNKLDLSKSFEEMSNLEKWILFFKHCGTDNELLKKLVSRDPLIEKAYNEYVKFTGDKELRTMIDRVIEARRIKNSEIYFAVQKERKKE